MINIYDGFNVRMRAMTRPTFPGETRLSLRQEFERMFNGGTHIWVWDGRGHNERRRKIFPPYKAQREPMAEDMFAQIRLFREILAHTPAIQITCEGWEADDVAGTLARIYANKGLSVVCHSNDLDWTQLETNPLICINGVQKRPAEPRWIPLYKALVGDPSDNIPGIAGFGPKTWNDLAAHWQTIEDAIRHNGTFEGIPLPKRLQNLRVTEDLQNALLITHIFNVPEDEINAGIQIGRPNRDAAELILGQYFL